MKKDEVIKKARAIQLHTRRLLNNFVSGDYRTMQKGVGFEFEQLAEYQIGSDIRFIDWKSSARMNKLLIKEFRQERSRTIFIIVDISGSQLFGSGSQYKYQLGAEVASIIAMAGIYARDAVGMLFVSDEVERYIPPARGISHGHHLMEQALTQEPRYKKTALKKAFEYLAHVQKQQALTFIISDFIDEDYIPFLPILFKRNDVVAIRCLDAREHALPSVGLVHCTDLETQEQMVIDIRNDYQLNAWLDARMRKQNELFKKYSIDCLDISSDNDAFIENIILFFKQRALRM